LDDDDDGDNEPPDDGDDVDENVLAFLMNGYNLYGTLHSSIIT